MTSDDWFAPTGNGFNVIDTSGAATYLSLLQGGANIQFSKGMSQLLYAKVNGKLWLDAAYARDRVSHAARSFLDNKEKKAGAKPLERPVKAAVR